MLHDPVLHRATTGTGDRRQSDRLPCPGQVVLSWLHDPETTIRLDLLDVGDGGYRLRSTLPILAGTVGILLRLLPEGTKLDQSVVVVWSCRDEDTATYEIGLRRF